MYPNLWVGNPALGPHRRIIPNISPQNASIASYYHESCQYRIRTLSSFVEGMLNRQVTLSGMMSTLAVLDVSLWKVHAVISSLMLEEMVFACKAVLALAATIVYVAVHKFDLVG